MGKTEGSLLRSWLSLTAGSRVSRSHLSGRRGLLAACLVVAGLTGASLSLENGEAVASSLCTDVTAGYVEDFSSPVDCIRLPAGTGIDIWVHDGNQTSFLGSNASCWEISNATANDVFIPTRTPQEWNAFWSNVVQNADISRIACNAGTLWSGWSGWSFVGSDTSRRTRSLRCTWNGIPIPVSNCGVEGDSSLEHRQTLLLSDWSAATSCSATCGGGSHQWTRSCTQVEGGPINDPMSGCPSDLSQWRSCNMHACPPTCDPNRNFSCGPDRRGDDWTCRGDVPRLDVYGWSCWRVNEPGESGGSFDRCQWCSNPGKTYDMWPRRYCRYFVPLNQQNQGMCRDDGESR